MIRRVFVLASLVSLLLWVGTVVLFMAMTSGRITCWARRGGPLYYAGHGRGLMISMGVVERWPCDERRWDTLALGWMPANWGQTHEYPFGVITDVSAGWAEVDGKGRAVWVARGQQWRLRPDFPFNKRSVYFPFWMPVVVFSVLPAGWIAVWMWGVRRSGQNERGYCAGCRYNLTGNASGVCPEWGTMVAGNAGKLV